MYLKTPKRYSRRQRARLISTRTCLVWILAPILIFIGVGIYQNSDRFTDPVNDMVDQLVGNAGETIRQVNAPRPTATPDPSSDIQRANESWRRGAIQDAVSIYQRISPNAPNDLLVYYRLALGLIMQGRLEDALVAAENAVTASPYAPDAWAIRSMALNRLGRNPEAIASAQQALSLIDLGNMRDDPTMAMSRARAQAFLAEAYLNVGQGDRALTTVESALETYPDSFEAYQVRGRINQELNFDFDAARADFQAAFDLAPNMVYVAIWLARVEQQRFENTDLAISMYQDIIDLNPGNPLVLYDLGDYYLRVEGNYTESSGYLSRCIESNPENAACYYLLGRAQLNQNETISSQNSFQSAIDLDPEGAGGRYYYWLAETYSSLGQCGEALRHLQTGYKIAQENQDTDLISAFEFSLNQCGAPVNTPEGEVTPEAETGEGDV